MNNSHMHKPKIYLFSYGDYDYNGRIRSLVHLFSSIGDCYVLTRGKKRNDPYQVIFNGSYIKFIISSIWNGIKYRNVDYLVAVNRKASVPVILLGKILRNKFIIQDCSELYLLSEVKHISGKIGCIFERIAIKGADIILCANKDRAIYMKNYYKLKSEPIVLENVHQLAYEGEKELNSAKLKLDYLFKPDEYRILATHGCDLARGIDTLVANLNRVKHNIHLIIVGNSTDEEKAVITKIVKDKCLNNVTILGRLNQTELKYLIDNSHIGIVNYHKNDINNLYCASGKVYEFAYGDCPMVMTNNPPLERLCIEYGIGVTDDSFAEGINTIIENYHQYLTNVRKFADSHTVEKCNEDFLRNLEKVLP